MEARRYTVNPETNCWEWRGAKNPRGYGKLTVNMKTVSAHRHAWMTFRGQIPNGQHVLHRCDNRGCVNPDHLFLGTHSDNMQDMAAKTRGRPRGKNQLSTADALQVRALSATGMYQRDIAKRFGVTPSNVSAIVRGRSF